MPAAVETPGQEIPEIPVGMPSSRMTSCVEFVGAPRPAAKLSVRSLLLTPSLFASRSTKARAKPSVIRIS